MFADSAKIECEPFPPKMKTLKECCVLPASEESVIERKCLTFSSDLSFSKKKAAMEECFLKEYAEMFGASGINGFFECR